MRHKKIRNLVEQVNKKLHETGIAKMWHEKGTLDKNDKIVAEKVIAPFVETVDKMFPWKTSEKSQRNASLAWFRENFINPNFREAMEPDWDKGKTVRFTSGFRTRAEQRKAMIEREDGLGMGKNSYANARTLLTPEEWKAGPKTPARRRGVTKLMTQKGPSIKNLFC